MAQDVTEKKINLSASTANVDAGTVSIETIRGNTQSKSESVEIEIQE